MKKKVSEILNVHYVEGNISCEPSKEEIKKAVDEKNLETRGYALESRLQGYLEAGCSYAAKCLSVAPMLPIFGWSKLFSMPKAAGMQLVSDSEWPRRASL